MLFKRSAFISVVDGAADPSSPDAPNEDDVGAHTVLLRTDGSEKAPVDDGPESSSRVAADSSARGRRHRRFMAISISMAAPSRGGETLGADSVAGPAARHNDYNM